MSSPPTETLPKRLEAYYTRYYRDTLGIPGWREIVAVRLADGPYERHRLDRLERAIGRSVRGLRLLNVGCGTGGFSALAAKAGAEVWSVDASTEAAALAAGRVSGGRVVVADAAALPMPTASVDVVYCASTLEHVAQPARAVREMIRVLRPDGRLYLHTPNRWACFEGHYKVFCLPGLPPPLTRAYLALRGRPAAFLGTLRCLTLAECRRYLEDAGACIVRLLDEDGQRRVGGPLWPLIRLYYRAFGIRPYLELVATPGGRA